MIRWRRNRGLARLTVGCWELVLCRKPAHASDVVVSVGIRSGAVVGRIWSVSVYGPRRRYGAVELELHGRQS